MKVFIVIVAIYSGLLPNIVVAADSTTSLNPVVNIRMVTGRSACTGEGEVGVTPNNKIVKCRSGVWTYQGVTEIEVVSNSRQIVPSDIGQIVTLTATCPVGKRVIDGGCALLSGNDYNSAQSMTTNTHLADMVTWQCSYEYLNSKATEPYFFFGVQPASISVWNYCGIY